jgi:CRP-like cAMP-binding protein
MHVNGLTQDDIDRLAADGRVDRVKRREIVPLDGPVVAIVVEGYFRVFRNAAFARDVTLGLSARGDVLAPNAAFGERSAESGAEALTDGHVLLVSADRFAEHANAQPSLYVRMAVDLGRRVTRVQQKLEEFSRAGVDARVAGALLDLGVDFGDPVEGGAWRIDVPLSQEDLARLAGTTRESCSSTVADFARRGLVRGGRLKGMVIVDSDALREIAGARLDA